MITQTRAVCFFLMLTCAGVALGRAAEAPADIVFTGQATSPISSGVALPEGRAHFWTSGTVPSVINAAGATSRERFGDTHAQGVSCLKNVAALLAQQGLSLKDVVYLRVYVTPDPELGGKPDFAGWFKAYGEFFNSAENPVKPARSTVGVAALVNADWLIEIEAVAVFPAGR
jgi:enamine deaminase RidA (YjgF/YER057c/UK114 family)